MYNKKKPPYMIYDDHCHLRAPSTMAPGPLPIFLAGARLPSRINSKFTDVSP